MYKKQLPMDGGSGEEIVNEAVAGGSSSWTTSAMALMHRGLEMVTKLLAYGYRKSRWRWISPPLTLFLLISYYYCGGRFLSSSSTELWEGGEDSSQHAKEDHQVQPPRNHTVLSSRVQMLEHVYRSVDVFRRNFREMERKFKVYVYPDGDPETFYQTPRKLTGKYSSEGYFFQNLGESQFMTNDSEAADLFFLPISCHKMRGKVSGVSGLLSFLHMRVISPHATRYICF